MRTVTRTVISGAADANQLGAVITASYLSQASATILIAGGTGITGTVKWRQSNDGGVTFSDIPGASVAINGNGTYTLGPTNFACDVLQTVYAHTGGTGGTITANAHATGPSASDGFAPAGDLTGNELTQTVIGLQGRSVSSAAPAGGQVLKWDATASAWVPGTDSGFAAGGDLTGNATSQTVVGIQGRSVSSTAPADGEVLKWNATATAWAPSADSGFSAGGDLSGNSLSQTVVGLQGHAVSVTVPNSGEVLKWNGTAWEPATDAGFSASGDLSGSASSQTVVGLQGHPVSSSSPSSGYVLAWDSTAWVPTAYNSFSAGGDLTGLPHSQTVVGLQGHAVSSSAPSSGQVLKYDGSAWAPGTDNAFSAGGDLSGSSSSQTVVAVQGRAVSSSSPSSGQVLSWSGSAWEPATVAAGGPARPALNGDESLIIRLNETLTPWSYSGSGGSGTLTAINNANGFLPQPNYVGTFGPAARVCNGKTGQSGVRIQADANSGSIHPASTATISCWFIMDAVPAGQYSLLFAKCNAMGLGYTPEIDLRVDASYGVMVRARMTSSAVVESSAGITTTLGVPHFVAATWDQSTGTFNLYLDGALVSTDTFAGSQISSLGGPWLVGGFDGNTSNICFAGKIWECRLNTSVLSAATIRQQYQTGMGWTG